jgi:hypothetical protein
MFVRAADEIACGAEIKRSFLSAGEEINVVRQLVLPMPLDSGFTRFARAPE